MYTSHSSSDLEATPLHAAIHAESCRPGNLPASSQVINISGNYRALPAGFPTSSTLRSGSSIPMPSIASFSYYRRQPTITTAVQRSGKKIALLLRRIKLNRVGARCRIRHSHLPKLAQCLRSIMPISHRLCADAFTSLRSSNTQSSTPAKSCLGKIQIAPSRSSWRLELLLRLSRWSTVGHQNCVKRRRRARGGRGAGGGGRGRGGRSMCGRRELRPGG